MSDHPPEGLQPTARSAPVYPPPWYIDLVRLRSGLTEAAGTRARPRMIWKSDPAITARDEADIAKLLALALEITRPSYIEGLPFGHQAHVLGLDVLEVREYLGETFREMGFQGPAATLIIEDEAAVALDLARIVRQTGHRVCGTAGHVKQAVAVASRTRPTLVLADVQLRDGPEAGIAAVQEIRLSGETAAVFVTAYPERVRHAMLSPLVVPKPFLAHDIQTAVWRALFRHGYTASAAAA
jgi:CheY-like chemotaxis protein